MADQTPTCRIVVKTLRAEEYVVEISGKTTIDELKHLVFEKTQIAVGRLRLIYQGRVLKDGKTAGDYGIEEGHVVHLVERQSAPADAASDQQPSVGARPSPAHPSSSRSAQQQPSPPQIDQLGTAVQQFAESIIQSLTNGATLPMTNTVAIVVEPNGQRTALHIPMMAQNGHSAHLNSNSEQPPHPPNAGPQGEQEPLHQTTTPDSSATSPHILAIRRQLRQLQQLTISRAITNISAMEAERVVLEQALGAQGLGDRTDTASHSDHSQHHAAAHETTAHSSNNQCEETSNLLSELAAVLNDISNMHDRLQPILRTCITVLNREPQLATPHTRSAAQNLLNRASGHMSSLMQIYATLSPIIAAIDIGNSSPGAPLISPLNPFVPAPFRRPSAPVAESFTSAATPQTAHQHAHMAAHAAAEAAARAAASAFITQPPGPGQFPTMTFNFEQRIQNPNAQQSQSQSHSHSQSRTTSSTTSHEQQATSNTSNSNTNANTPPTSAAQPQPSAQFSASTSTRANVAFDSSGAAPQINHMPTVIHQIVTGFMADAQYPPLPVNNPLNINLRPAFNFLSGQSTATNRTVPPTSSDSDNSSQTSHTTGVSPSSTHNVPLSNASQTVSDTLNPARELDITDADAQDRGVKRVASCHSDLHDDSNV